MLPASILMYPHMVTVRPTAKTAGAQGSEQDSDASGGADLFLPAFGTRHPSRGMSERIEAEANFVRGRRYWIVYTEIDPGVITDDTLLLRLNPEDLNHDRSLTVIAPAFDASDGALNCWQTECFEET
jgi:hypothetical protein